MTTSNDPSVFFVDATTIGIRFETGRVTNEGTVQDYVRQAGDTVDSGGWVYRDNKPIGRLIGTDDTHIHLLDSFEDTGESAAFAPINPGADGSNRTAAIDLESNIRIVHSDGSSDAPDAIYRKSKVLDSAQVDVWGFKFVTEHTVYLKLDEPLTVGESFTIDFSIAGIADRTATFDPNTVRSDAVHVSQIGFDVDDTIKVGYLSQWLGLDAGRASDDPDRIGAAQYEVGTAFHIVDQVTGRSVHDGQIALSKAADTPSNFWLNYSQTDVYKIDFSAVDTAGSYKIVVDGVGTSYEFTIGESNWDDAYYTTARGLYHQRSGIALEEPYTDWERPSNFTESDGITVYQSTATWIDESLNPNNGGQDRFALLVAGDTGEVVANAWGGWHDAGDWDRNTNHLDSVEDLLLLVETQSDFAAGTDLNLPESGNTLPDTLDEALWGLDFFQRLQKPDGGVPGGIESSSHPETLGASWLESETVYLYAPDALTSYKYAARAAWAAELVRPHDAERAQGYLDSAIRAVAWADANTPDWLVSNSEFQKEKNFAEVQLYRATGDSAWHDRYLDSTIYTEDGYYEWYEHQTDAAFVYARLDASLVDADVQARARQDVLNEADYNINEFQSRGSYGEVQNPHVGHVFGSGPANPEVAADLFTRSHVLTGDDKYLSALIHATQFALGNNSDNSSYVTGLGEEQPREILHLDAEATGTAPPPGLVLYGTVNVFNAGYQFWHGLIDPALYPNNPYEWPVHESGQGFFYSIQTAEFTVNQGTSKLALATGYIAAADPGGWTAAAAEAGLTLTGTAGNDVLTGADRADVMSGLAGNDRLTGGAGTDSLAGGLGVDRLYGGDDSDTLTGDGGRDLLHGDAGDDSLNGGLGNDILVGGDGADHLDGDLNDDRLSGDLGDDRLFGGAGNDRALGGEGADSLSGNAGDDLLYGNAGDDSLSGGLGNDVLSGGDGADRIGGDAGNDRLSGDGGNDTLSGGAGTDRLAGGAGDDRVEGGTGADRLYGGTGADVFVFRTIADSGIGAARDVITDFVSGQDRIDLSAIDAIAGGADDAFHLLGAVAFDGSQGALITGRWGNSLLLRADIDGDRVSDFDLVLSNVTQFGAGDLLA